MKPAGSRVVDERRPPHRDPARGWKDIFWRVYEEINKDRILAVAAGVTFYGLLALFPALAALCGPLMAASADRITSGPGAPQSAPEQR